VLKPCKQNCPSVEQPIVDLSDQPGTYSSTCTLTQSNLYWRYSAAESVWSDIPAWVLRQKGIIQHGGEGSLRKL